MPGNAGATHPPRQCRLRTFRNLKQRTSPVTPPRRHDPHHHVLPPDNARNHPSIAIILKRVVLLFWHTLAHRPLAHRRLGPSQVFPIVLGHDGANAKPGFRQRPAIYASVAAGPSDDRRPQRLLALHRFPVLLPLSQPRPEA